MGIYDHFDPSKTLNYYVYIVNAFNGPLRYIKNHHHIIFIFLGLFVRQIKWSVSTPLVFGFYKYWIDIY